MRNSFDIKRACLSIMLAVAMVFSTMIAFTGETTAETVVESELSMPGTPPIPPYTIYGIIYNEINMPVSDATVTITNIRTDESLDAEVYENGAYEGILEDLPSGYDVGDNIEILVTTASETISKFIAVEQLGFGERIDIYFGDGKNNAGSKNILATGNKIQNNPVERTMLNDYETSSINTWPERIAENPEPIIIDPVLTKSDNEPVAEITLVEISAPPYYRLAFTEKDNKIEITLRNDWTDVDDDFEHEDDDEDDNGKEMEKDSEDHGKKAKVIVDLYQVGPDGISESFLKTIHFGKIKPEKEKTKHVEWTPTQTGRNWLRGEIYIKGHGHERILVNEFKESFSVVAGWKPILALGPTKITEPTVWDNLTVIINGDLINDASLEIRNSYVVADDVFVNFIMTVSPGSVLDPNATFDGEFKIQVNGTGNLTVYGIVLNQNTNYHYWFYMNGTLLVGQDPLAPFEPPGIVENTYGPSDLSQPGGIIATTDNVLIENGATIRDGATHGIYLMNNSNAVIRDSFIRDNGGDGIVSVDGSTPQIEGNTIEWNERYGINANNSLPVIKNSNTIQYNGQDGIFVEGVINAEGKPSYVPGADLGYYIWYDGAGWYIRWSGDGSLNYFNGTITFNGLTAPIVASPVDLDLADTFSISGTSISFNATEDIGEEGFDFTFSGASVNFDLWLNDVRVTGSVYIGPGGMNPVSIPFTLAEGVTITDNMIKDNFASGLHLVNTNIPIIDNMISSNGLAPVFEDDFEIDVGWTNESLWHRVSNESGTAPLWNISHSGNWSFWYGINKTTTGDYDSGLRNLGNLTSPTIDIINATSAALTFWSWYETDTTGTATDQRWVIIQNDSVPDASIQLYGEPMNEWTRYVINISQFAGSTINITFSFDTVDDLDNANQGWYIDDVEVITSYPVLEGHGIHLEGQTPVLIYNNTITLNNQHGIYGINAHNSTIDNNTVSDNRKNGINLESSSNNSIVDNTISNNNYGIYLSGSDGNTIFYNNVSSNKDDAIHLIASDSNTLTENNANGSGQNVGIQLDSSSDNTLTNNNASDNEVGIRLDFSSNNNTLTDNTVNSNSYGIILYSSSNNNNLTDNTVNSNNYGIILDSSSDNTLINNNASNNWYGIRLDFSSNYNTLTNNTVNSNSYGIFFWENSNSNTFVNNTVNSNWYGIFFWKSSDTIINSTISNSGLYDFYFNGDSHATALNTSFNKTKVYFNDDLSTLTVQWFMDVRVVDENYAPVPGASVWVNDTFGSNVVTSTTPPDGWISWIRATEYVQKDNNGNKNGNDPGEKILYTPHNITASKAILTGWAMPEPFMDRNKEVYVLLGFGYGYNIFLHKGWNFVSVPYRPFNMSSSNLQTVLTTIDGKYDVVQWYDASDITQTIAVTNELVFGPAVGGETGPFSLGNTTINDISLYNDAEGLWILGEDYTFDWTTGTIDISAGATHLNAGESLIAFYNYTKPADPWKTYNVNYPGTPELTHLDHTMGFWIKMLEDSTLFSIGDKITPTNITMYEGWNMVGYPTDNRSVNVSTAFASIDAYRDKPVYGYYEDEPYFVGSYGEDYIMKPGEAYWVYVNATTVWTVNW